MSVATIEIDVLELLKSYGLTSGYFAYGTLFYDADEPCIDDIGLIEELKENFGALEINESRGEIAIDFIAE